MFSTKSKRFHSLEAACACLAARDKLRNSTTFKLAALLSTAVLLLGTPAITVALDSSSPIQGRSEILEKSRIVEKDWVSYERTIRLADSTGLHHYVSEVTTLEKAAAGDDESKAMPQPKLRFSFIPRFNCAPIISVVVPADRIEEADRRKILSALNQLKFLVDGTSIAFPALTEFSDTSLMAHYDTELRRRNNFRILVEAGSAVQIELKLDGNAHVYDYSLFGSKRSISRSLSNCQTHSN